MALLRVVLIVALVGGLIVWVMAAGLPVSGGAPPGTQAARADRREAGRSAAHATGGMSDLDVEISRLQRALSAMPALSSGARDLFRFGGPPGKSPDDSSHQPPVSAAVADPSPDRPPMQLLGIATDGDPENVVRTAIIATPRQLFLLREGQQMALRFLVTRIGEDAVELRDLATDTTFRLGLH
jgi:hypothetical protein